MSSIRERVERGEVMPRVVKVACDMAYDFVGDSGFSSEEIELLCNFAGNAAYYLVSKFREGTDYPTQHRTRLYELKLDVEAINSKRELANMLPLVQMIAFSAVLGDIANKERFYVGSD